MGDGDSRAASGRAGWRRAGGARAARRSVIAASCWALLLVLSFFAARAQARELYWRELAVRARLDADGRLHVREQQAMVFTGDWNGGERTFRLNGEQELTLESVVRVDREKGELELRSGDLEAVDEYAWANGGERVLRWRSRLPGDPSFDHTPITYALRYQLENILLREGDDRYLLDHDFAFTERDGSIERFTLELDIDPSWQVEGSPSRHLTLGPLPPGEGAVLRLPLRYVGAGTPSGVLQPAPVLVRALLAGLLLVFMFRPLRRLLRRERALGRFAPLAALDAIDEGWLREHVLSLQPELVGALYDCRTGAAEVAAVLARMVQEKKLASRVTRVPGWLRGHDNLELRLLVARETLEGYERALVKGLFFAGDETSSDAIRAHYASRGFDPAARLEKPLRERVEAMLGSSDDDNLGVGAFVTGALLLAASVLALVLRPSELSIVMPSLMGAMFFGTPALIVAYRWRQDMTATAWGALKFLLPVGLAVLGIAAQLLGSDVSLSGSVALASLGLFVAHVVAFAGRSADGAEGVALRKRLTAARRYFAHELRRPEPRLDDAWFPYLMALELGQNVEGWFRAFGGSGGGGAFSAMGGHRRTTSFRPSRTGSLGGGASKGWTGGGGAFGGAGATGTWIAATGAMAAGVARANSGSSSSGGGGGGGSSGGGGGGGW